MVFTRERGVGSRRRTVHTRTSTAPTPPLSTSSTLENSVPFPADPQMGSPAAHTLSGRPTRAETRLILSRPFVSLRLVDEFTDGVVNSLRYTNLSAPEHPGGFV